MKIVITGGSGFLGSHVADELSKNGHKISIFDKKKSKWIKSDQKIYIGDILNYKNLEMSNIIYKDPINKMSIIFNNNKTNVEPLLIYTPVLRVKSIMNNQLILDLTNNTNFHDFLRRIDELNISDVDITITNKYSDMSVKELKEKCIELGLKHSGNKHTLANRIVDKLK